MELQQSEKPTKPKKWVVMCAVIMTIVVVITCVSLVRCPQLYTTQRNIENIKRLANKKIIQSDDYHYDSCEVYPVYNQDDNICVYLVEMQPDGFFFVSVRVPTIYNYSRYMYTVIRTWRRFCYGNTNMAQHEQYTAGWKMVNNRYYETDDKDNYIEHKASPYAEAKVLDQKLYLLDTDISYRKVPAIRQGNSFINLITMETVDMQNIQSDNATEEFVPYISVVFHSGANLD